MVWNLFGPDERSQSSSKTGGSSPYSPVDSNYKNKSSGNNHHSHPKHKSVVGEDTEKTVDEALECDYERDCTPLYRRIEDEEWGYVTKFLDSGYWPGNFFADAISPADQARTWVTRFDPHDAKKVRWSQLPLHLAIVVDAPYEMVGRLIELYPQAVRCTDDQHMLPLHLAMRHGSSDRIVDLLLAAFPEAVNARGKNDRTPIECAIRGPNKVRGRILGAFVEKSKAKATKSAVSAYTREIANLKAQLEDKETELGDVRSKLTALDTAKAAIEYELNQKITELKVSQAKMETDADKRVEEVESSRLVEEFEISKKIKELEAEKQDLEVAHQRAKEEEIGLRQELETVQMHVVQSTSPGDLHSLKAEVQSLKAYRLEHSRSQAKEDMNAIKQQLANEVAKADGASRNELKEMQKTIDGLRTVSIKATSNEDISTLKAELEALRKELREREEASKAKVDIVMLKKALEKELKDTENKTPEQITAILAATKDLNIAELENKTHGELITLREELQALKQSLKERELETRTRTDLEQLRESVHEQLKISEGKTKVELKDMKNTVESININDLEKKTNDELLSIHRELEELKEQLKEKEQTTKELQEVTMLRKSLEMDLRKSKGSAEKHVHIQAMKVAVKNASHPTIQDKTAEELAVLKSELAALRDEVKLHEEAKETKAELEALRSQVEEQMKVSEGKTREELLAIKEAVDKINMTDLESKNREKFDEMKKELGTVRQSLIDKQVAKKLKLELMIMRKALEAELAANQGQNHAEVEALRKSMENLHETKLQDKSADELTALKQEISALKLQMKEKDDAVKDLEKLKSVVEKKLETSEGETTEDLQALKTAVDAVDLKRVTSMSKEDWSAVKKEIAVLKTEIHDPEQAAKTTEELNNFKLALEEEMKHATASTKEELEKMKTKVDGIDVEKLEGQPAWDELKSDVESLKMQLKVKECEGLMESLNDGLKNTKGMSRLEINRVRRTLSEVDMNLESLDYAQLCAKKREIEVIRDEINADSVAKPHKTEKKGLKKMLKRFAFGMKKSRSGSMPSTPTKKNSEDLGVDIVDAPESLLMPPSVGLGDTQRSMADSEEDSEEEASRKSGAKKTGGLPPRAPSSKTTPLASLATETPKVVPSCCDPLSVPPGLTVEAPQKQLADSTAPTPQAGNNSSSGAAPTSTKSAPPSVNDAAPPASDEKPVAPVPLARASSKGSRASSKMSNKSESCAPIPLARASSKGSRASSKTSKKSESSASKTNANDETGSLSSKRSKRSVMSKRSFLSARSSKSSKSSGRSRKSKTSTGTPSPKPSPATSRSNTPTAPGAAPPINKSDSRPATPARSTTPESAVDTAPESPVTPVPQMTDAAAPLDPEMVKKVMTSQTMVNENDEGHTEIEISPAESPVEEATAEPAGNNATSPSDPSTTEEPISSPLAA